MFALALPGLVGFALPAAQAAELPPERTVERPLWEVGLGAGALRLPHYRGAGQSHNLLVPVPYLVYRGDILKSDREGTRALLYESERVNFDVSAGVGVPVRSNENDARRGMPDLATTLDLGPNLNWTLGRGRFGERRDEWELTLRAPLCATFTLESKPRHIGWSSTPHINLDLRRASGWEIGVLTGPVLADRGVNGYFYNVAPEHATATRPAYAAHGGFSGWQTMGSLSRRFDKHWFGVVVQFDSLRGAGFADSPLVRQRQQLSVGIAMSWILATSEQLVRVPE